LTEGLEGKPISLVNELKAYRGIITGLQNLYQAYGTSEQVRFTTIEKRVFKHSLTSVGGQLQEDAEILKDASISLNKRNAVILRKGEKEIIQNNILVMAKLWENILLEGALPLGVPIR